MKNLTKLINETDFNKLIEEPDRKQNLRCKINTGYICNSDCNFCYFHSKRDSRNFSLDAIKKQLHFAKDFGVKSVDFSGGEPTLHPNFIHAIKYANELEFKSICCITNGSKFSTKSYLRECIDNGLNDVLFSIHGTEILHDSITNRNGFFKKVIKAIQNSKRLNIRYRINTVVTKQNYKNLPELAEVIHKLEPHQWNMIIYKMQYECGNPLVDNFISHEKSSSKIKEAIDITKSVIPIINVRYIPFCFMRGHEKHVTNYHQKKYDPFEWSNYLLQKFEETEECILNMKYDPNCGNSTELNNESVKGVRKTYKKPFRCTLCKDFLICDGFENKYAEIRYIDMEASPDNKPMIKDPLYYRRTYDC